MNRKQPYYNPITCDFHIIKEERVHEWINKDDYVHTRRYTLKPLRDGLTEYVDKFVWTGSSYKLSGGVGDYTVEEDARPKNVYTVYHFKFDMPLKKGETIDVEAKWEAKGPAKPFFSTTIEEPTDLLVMKVMLFPESGIKKVNCEVETHKGAKCPDEREKRDLDSNGEYVWEVPKPKILHHYEINWKTNII